MNRLWLIGLVLVAAATGTGTVAVHAHDVASYNGCVTRQRAYGFKPEQSIAPNDDNPALDVPCVRNWP